MKAKTIGKNQKRRIEEIFNNAINIRSYTLNNGFAGKKCDKIGYDRQNWLLKEFLDWRQFDFSRLTMISGFGKYRLHIHSNCWYEFEGIKV